MTPTEVGRPALSRRPKSGRDVDDDPGPPGPDPLVRLPRAVEHAHEPEVLGVDDPVDVGAAPRGAVVVDHRDEQALDVERELVAEQQDEQQRYHHREPQVRGIPQELPGLLPGDGERAIETEPTHGRAPRRAAR